MARYRCLQAHFLDRVYEIGEEITMPDDWRPTPNLDALNEAAVLAVYREGPDKSHFNCGVGGEVDPMSIALDRMGQHRLTRWVCEPIHPSLYHKSWKLTGMGSHLPEIREC